MGLPGQVGDTGATGATGIQIRDIKRRFVRQAAGCPGMLLSEFEKTCTATDSKKTLKRFINVWNSLPADVDFSSFPRFKQSVEQVHFSQFLQCDVL